MKNFKNNNWNVEVVYLKEINKYSILVNNKFVWTHYLAYELEQDAIDKDDFYLTNRRKILNGKSTIFVQINSEEKAKRLAINFKKLLDNNIYTHKGKLTLITV